MAGVPRPLPRSWLVTAGVLAPLLLSAVLSTARSAVDSATACLLLVLVVVATAAAGDRVAGLAAALASAAGFDFFLTEPYYSLVIRDRDNIEITVLLLLIGAGVTELALWGRRQQERAGVRAGYLDGVLMAAELISLHDRPAEEMAATVAQQIADVLGVDGCRFVVSATPDPRHAVLNPDGTVTRGGRPMDVDRHGWPAIEETALIVRRGPHALGHFLITSPGRMVYPSLEQRRVAVLLADQMGAVLGRA